MNNQAYYKGQEMVCLFPFPNAWGPPMGSMVTIEEFMVVTPLLGGLLLFKGYLSTYQAKHFIDRKEFNQQMLALPKGHIPQQLIPLPKHYKLN